MHAEIPSHSCGTGLVLSVRVRVLTLCSRVSFAHLHSSVKEMRLHKPWGLQDPIPVAAWTPVCSPAPRAAQMVHKLLPPSAGWPAEL